MAVTLSSGPIFVFNLGTLQRLQNNSIEDKFYFMYLFFCWSCSLSFGMLFGQDITVYNHNRNASVLPSIGKKTSPCAEGVMGVPGSDNRRRPVPEDCLVIIWVTVFTRGDSRRNTGFSWPWASLKTKQERSLGVWSFFMFLITGVLY